MKTIHCNEYNIYIGGNAQFTELIQSFKPSSIFVLVDENTEKYCLHHMLEFLREDFHTIKIKSGEAEKNLDTCQYIWNSLLKGGADRHSILINLGGGVIGDLGGFCAATYMRGITFIQVPTTLTSQVDASIGGKTGVDFLNRKNIIGAFANPGAVFVFPEFLETLPIEHLRSGYAEMLKHALIADVNQWEILKQGIPTNQSDLETAIIHSIQLKKSIVDQDPFESGVRKILNFGHTIGHALESYWMESKTPLLHGEAVAIGMVCEAFLSYRLGLLSEQEFFEIRHVILDIFGHFPKYLKPTESLIRLLVSDKKNYKGEIRFALLDHLGSATYDIKVDSYDVLDCFEFYKDKELVY
ncbi:MAG: 3-dehydroquinate synthase [Saprospiraceae bacterium]